MNATAPAARGLGAWLQGAALGQPGEVITFYSYKGGTGRTMALVNCGGLMAQHLPAEAAPVLLVDFDLEAPGLHRYLQPCLDARQALEGPGLLEWFEAIAERVDAALAETGSPAIDDEQAVRIVQSIDLDPYLTPVQLPGSTAMRLLKAGRFDKHYDSRVMQFDWTALHERAPGLWRAVAAQLAAGHSHVLLDSRTGLSDTSGICTMLLPDTLVVVFTPNAQSLTGIDHVVRRAVQYRARSDDLRPLKVYPLASRVDQQVEHFRQVWRFGQAAHPLFGDVDGYQPLFERLFASTLATNEPALGMRLSAYFDQAQVPHAADYAFGERLCFLSGAASDSLSIRNAYEQFIPWLASGAPAWGQPAEARDETQARAWLHRCGADLPCPAGAAGAGWFERIATAAHAAPWSHDALQALAPATRFDVALPLALAHAHGGDLQAAQAALNMALDSFDENSAPAADPRAAVALLGIWSGRPVPAGSAGQRIGDWLDTLDRLMARWRPLRADRTPWLQTLLQLLARWRLAAPAEALRQRARQRGLLDEAEAANAILQTLPAPVPAPSARRWSSDGVERLVPTPTLADVRLSWQGDEAAADLPWAEGAERPLGGRDAPERLADTPYVIDAELDRQT